MEKLPLFREAAALRNGERGPRTILIRQLWSHGVLTCVVVACFLAILAFLYLGEYTRKAKVQGYVVPEAGVVKVYARQPATVVRVLVGEGAFVRKGDLLAELSPEQQTRWGAAQERIGEQLALRRESFDSEVARIRLLHDEKLRTATARLELLLEEERQLAARIATQAQRLAAAESVFAKYTHLNNERFLSDGAMQERRGELLEHKGKLEDLLRARQALHRDSLAVRADIQALPVNLQTEISSLQRAAAEVRSAEIENEARRSEHVHAPQDGWVTALQASPGKFAVPGQPLMSLIPASAGMGVDLYVPSRAIGFVRTGSEARLQFQPFPYQKFGSHTGVVSKIARTAVPASELPFPAPASEGLYVVSVRLSQDHVMAYGKPEKLQAGMQVTADLFLDRRRLIEWLVEPLFTLAGRT